MRRIKTKTAIAAASLTTLAVATGFPAYAAHLTDYKVEFTDPSGFGASGSANLVFDSIANTLQVDITASGFAADMLHVAHIHGGFDGAGNPVESVTPTLADDTDGDGVLELLEGAPLYGGILLSLFDEDNTDNGFNGFSGAPGGDIDFGFTYDLLNTAAFNVDPNGDGDTSDAITAATLGPLDLREIVIHGAFLAPGIGGVGNEADDAAIIQNGGYSTLVPVLVGKITPVAPVPLPAAGWLMVAGIAGLGVLRRRNTRT